jgi:hypothetical protein
LCKTTFLKSRVYYPENILGCCVSQYSKELCTLLMIRFRKLCLASGIASLLVALGCGGSGSLILPHQKGNFTNADFKGSYVFQSHGFLLTNLGALDSYREVGVVTTDGNGNVTGGVDYASIGSGGLVQSSAPLTGSYTIANDGTGQLVLNSSGLGVLSGSQQISFAVTLANSSKAELVEADAFATGAGGAELQDSTAITAVPSGAFVFGLHEEADPQTGQSASQVGGITISGGAVTGSMDQNMLSAASTSNLTGNLGAPAGLGVGTGLFTDSSNNTTDFFYFIVNSGKFVFLVSDANAIGSGSAEAQSGTVGNGLSGSYAFGSRGDDAFAPSAIATVGQFTGSGATISSGAFDSLQDSSNYSQNVSFTGTPTTTTNNPSPQGRVEVTLNTGDVLVFWMVNSSRAFFIDESGAAVEDGTADLQTTGSFSASTMNGQFAIAMDGIDLNAGSVARIGTLQFDGNGKSVMVELVNDAGAGVQNPGALAGSYQVAGNGRITTTLSNGGGELDLVLYAISGAQSYVLQVDPNASANTSGFLELQQ